MLLAATAAGIVAIDDRETLFISEDGARSWRELASVPDTNAVLTI